MRPAVCGFRFASFTFSTDAAAFQFVNAACRIPHAACLLPQPVSDSSARHDKVSVCLCTEKRESSHNLTSNFPLARNDNGASFLSLCPSRTWRVPRVASSFRFRGLLLRLLIICSTKTFTAVDNNKSSGGDKFPGLGQTLKLKFNLMATK